MTVFGEKVTSEAMVSDFSRKGLNAGIHCTNMHSPGSRQSEDVAVPSLPLEHLLRQIPADGVTIELLKIDAQGADLAVFKTTGGEKGRVRRVLMEVQDLRKDDWLFMYENGSNKDEMVQVMSDFGYTSVTCIVNNCALLEMDCTFSVPEQGHYYYHYY